MYGLKPFLLNEGLLGGSTHINRHVSPFRDHCSTKSTAAPELRSEGGAEAVDGVPGRPFNPIFHGTPFLLPRSPLRGPILSDPRHHGFTGSAVNEPAKTLSAEYLVATLQGSILACGDSISSSARYRTNRLENCRYRVSPQASSPSPWGSQGKSELLSRIHRMIRNSP